MRIEEASREQEAILREIVAGLRPTALEAIRLGTDPQHGVAVSVEFPADADVRGTWEGMVLARAFRDRSAAAQLPPVAWLQTPWSGNVLGGRGHRAEAPTAEEIARRVRSAASATNGLLEQLEVVNPLGLAQRVTLAVEHVHAFLRYGLAAFLELSRHHDDSLDGSFVEIVDGNDQPAWVAGKAGHWGMRSARADVVCCAPHRGGIDDPGPPPCKVLR